MELLIRIAGVLLIILASIHIFFPRYFEWKKEFAGVSLINRQMMYVHCLFIGLVVLFFGVLSLVSANELIHTSLGNKISFGMGLFWVIRLIVQFFGYSPQLWRGKRMETTMHIIFSILWTFLSVVFLLAATY